MNEEELLDEIENALDRVANKVIYVTEEEFMDCCGCMNLAKEPDGEHDMSAYEGYVCLASHSHEDAWGFPIDGCCERREND